jgi:hypothetical protein
MLSPFRQFPVKGVGVDADLIAELIELCEEIDRRTAAFQAPTGLYCPVGCGICCSSVTVEATVPEMVPAARELFRRGEALGCLGQKGLAHQLQTGRWGVWPCLPRPGR